VKLAELNPLGCSFKQTILTRWQGTNQYHVSIYYAYILCTYTHNIHINPPAYLYRMFRQYLNDGNSSSSFFTRTPSVNPLRQRPVPPVIFPSLFFACAKSGGKMKIVTEKWKVIISVGVWLCGDLERILAAVKLSALMQCKGFPHFPLLSLARISTLCCTLLRLTLIGQLPFKIYAKVSDEMGCHFWLLRAANLPGDAILFYFI